MYRQLLIPVDGSDQARTAATRAYTLAESLGADVHVLAVAETGVLASVKLPGEAKPAMEAFTEEAERFVEDVLAEGREEGLSPTGEVRVGIPVTEILDCVEEIGADLIVMGSRGRGGFERALLGSVTEGVTRYGEVDVLVVDPSTTAD